MNNQLQKTFLGKEIVFTPDGWINATQTIKALEAKHLNGFMKSKYFNEYLEAYCKYHQVTREQVIRIVKGNFSNSDQTKRSITQQGTFLHPDLVVLFARWINPDFAVWCDTIIKQILTGELEVRYKNLRQDYDQLEEKHDKLFEELRLYQRPEENNPNL
jgi:ethanolamine utilization protein EutQ (cupin superfamily)